MKRKNKPETLQCTAVINIKTGNCYGRTLYIYHGLLDNKGHLLTGNCYGSTLYIYHGLLDNKGHLLIGNCYGSTLYIYHGLLDNKGRLPYELNCIWIMDPGIFSHLMDEVGAQD